MDKLKKSDRFPEPGGPVVEIIMDGVGVAPEGPGNAVVEARTPTLDWLIANNPHTVVAGPRHRRRPALRRRHGQLRGGPQRAGRRPDLRPGRQAGEQGDRDRQPLRGRGLEGHRGALEGPQVDAAPDRAPLRRQRPQPHRPAPGPHRRGGPGRSDPPPRPHPDRRPRRGRAHGPHLHRAPGGGPGEAPGRRARLPHRLRRRPHDRHHGPLRGRLEHRGAGLEGPRPGRGPALPLGQRGGPDPLRRGPGRQRPVPSSPSSSWTTTTSPWGGWPTATRSSSSTSAATGPSRSRAPSRTRSSTSSTAAPPSTCSTPG